MLGEIGRMNNLYFERITRKEDIDQIRDWLSDIDLVRMVKLRETPLTEEEFQEYLNTQSYIVYADGLAIGYARMFLIQEPQSCELSIVIANESYRGKGIGTKILESMVNTVQQLGLTKIYWATADYNYPSIKLVKKFGFKFYKLIPEVVSVRGEKRDALIYKYGE